MWFPLFTPDGEEVYPIRNDGKEGRWRIGKENALTKAILHDPNEAHWEKCEYDDDVIVNGKHERWVPFEKIRDEKKSFGWNTWLDGYGTNADATAVIKAIFGDKIFDTPKPVSLIEWIVNLHDDDSAIILDSFAGSGTTAHAVLKANQADGGHRKFILVEMGEYADSITAERVKRVISGYGEGEKAVAGLPGNFGYYELGPALMNGDVLNEEIPTAKIREYVYYSEARQSLPPVSYEEPYLLGKHAGSAYYFYYEKNDITTLNHSFLHTVKTPAEAYVIYADLCTLNEAEMEKHHITFKKIPRDIARL